jgi:hypothetical protein
LAGETEVLGENLPQCRFVHHKPHMLCPDAKPGRRVGKPATKRLSYGTTYALFIRRVVRKRANRRCFHGLIVINCSYVPERTMFSRQLDDCTLLLLSLLLFKVKKHLNKMKSVFKHTTVLNDYSKYVHKLPTEI